MKCSFFQVSFKTVSITEVYILSSLIHIYMPINKPRKRSTRLSINLSLIKSFDGFDLEQAENDGKVIDRASPKILHVRLSIISYT